VRWVCGNRRFELEHSALVMGIVNVTPDSFSDGGRHLDPAAAVAHARALVAEGADLVDLGAESTRPGAEPVPAAEQLRRLMPALAELARDPELCLSVDTADAQVAEAALEAGAHVVNDVSALSDPRMARVVAERGAGVVLMHMRGTPRTMQQEARYEDVARQVRDWLAARVAQAQRAGIAEEQIAIDPGIGFAKTLEHNLELLARLDELEEIGRPVLVGVSRKSFLGKLLDLPVERRVEAGAAAAAVAVFQGAHIVRTHDIGATVKMARIAEALRAARRGPASPAAAGSTESPRARERARRGGRGNDA
jgi:dihydropteroate synthase